jgi:hypothetical protein
VRPQSVAHMQQGWEVCEWSMQLVLHEQEIARCPTWSGKHKCCRMRRVRVAGETQQSVDACLTIGRSGVYRSGDRHDLDDGQHDRRSVARLSLRSCWQGWGVIPRFSIRGFGCFFLVLGGVFFFFLISPYFQLVVYIRHRPDRIFWSD